MVAVVRLVVLSWLCVIISFVPFISGYHEKIQQFAQSILKNNDSMHISIKAISLMHNRELCAINEHHHFMPASNTKLFTAVLALEYLGPDYCFETNIMTDGILQGTILQGSLYLKSSGDPSLRREDIEQLITALQEHHITIVTGDICIDVTEFDDDFFSPGSCIDDIGYAWNTPTTSLIVDGKAVCLDVPHGGIFVSDDRMQATFHNIRTDLYTMFAHNNIQVRGSIMLRPYPKNARLLAILCIRSKPVSMLIQHMMKESDNLYADCLFKKVGAMFAGTPGSWDKGYLALKDLLGRIGIDPQELVVKDGSGRSRYNLISSSHIITVLQWAYKQPYFLHLFESFSIAGTDGTLKARMKELGSSIRGKTGTLGGVSALCGYAFLHNDLIAFSILVNGFVSSSVYNPPCKTDVEDAFCRFLVAQ